MKKIDLIHNLVATRSLSREEHNATALLVTAVLLDVESAGKVQ